MKTLTLLAVFAFYCGSLFSQDKIVSIEDLKSLEGNWRGTIEYFDAIKKKENLVLQTELIAEFKKGVLILNFKYYDKNGEFTRKKEKFIISEDGTTIEDNSIWQVLEVAKSESNGDMKLAMKSDGEEHDCELRKTISIVNGKLCISKEELVGSDKVVNSLYSFNFEKLDHKLWR